MIGPEVPANIASNRSTAEDGQEAGPSLSMGPAVPHEVLARSKGVPPTEGTVEDDDDDDDDYAPALPPDLVAARGSHAVPAASTKQVQGPTLPPHMRGRQYGASDEDDDDDDYGPKPLPSGVVVQESDGVREFLEKEERRRKQVEEAAKPKALKRDEWMLVPPSSSDLLGSIDPTKLTKARQFARTAAPSRDVDSSLWTETPAERQQRLADEVAGKRRRAVNADPDAVDDDKEQEVRKRRRRDEEIRKGVDEYTRTNRGGRLLDQHAEKSSKDTKQKDVEDEGPPALWDHSRDMALSGRLMDDSSRDKLIREARGLSDRFGTGKTGGFL